MIGFSDFEQNIFGIIIKLNLRLWKNYLISKCKEFFLFSDVNCVTASENVIITNSTNKNFILYLISDVIFKRIQDWESSYCMSKNSLKFTEFWEATDNV